MAEPTWEVVPATGAPEPEPSRESPWNAARLGVAFAVAIVSDALSVWLEFAPPLQWTLDIATALALFLALGRQWLLLPPLITEAMPGLALLPAWVLVVASIAAWGRVNPLVGRPHP